MTGLSVVYMVQEEQDEVVDMEPVQWWQTSQGTRQDRVDRLGIGGEGVDMLEAWHGEFVPCTRGLLVWPQNHLMTVSQFGPQNRARKPVITEMVFGCIGKLRSGDTWRDHGACIRGIKA
jgi:hypothetical protein